MPEGGEENQVLREEKAREILLSFTARDRLFYLNASLTLISRYLFNDCVKENSPESHQKIQKMKKFYLAFANNIWEALSFPLEREEQVFPLVSLNGLFSIVKRITPEWEFNKFIDFATQERILEGDSGLANLSGIIGFWGKYDRGDRRRREICNEYFRKKIEPALGLIGELYRERKFSYFFGNVACGNFDTALLVDKSAGSEPEDEQVKIFRLYQYSRKAGIMFGQESQKFRSLDFEFEGVDPDCGICLVDGFCCAGTSIEKSIEGFLEERKHSGPIYVFIGRGTYPITRFEFDQLYPDPEEKLLFPGEEAPGCMFLKLIQPVINN